MESVVANNCGRKRLCRENVSRRKSQRLHKAPNVLVLTPLDTRNASFLLRLGFFLDHLVKTGHIAEYRVNDLSYYPSVDALIIQRHVPFTETLIDLLLRDPKPIIYETDDLLHLVPFYHGQYTRALRSTLAAYLGFLHAWDASIITTNPYLARKLHAYSTNVQVIANTLPIAIPQKQHSDNLPVLISFYGTPTHARDFSAIGDALPRIAARYKEKIRFLFIGYDPIDLRAQKIPIEYHPFMDDYLRTLEYFRECKPAIGLAPLADNLFNRAKSTIKYLDYTYAGAVGVYSNIIPYRKIQGGIVVNNQSDAWYTGLCRLIEDNALRRQLLTNAREEVENKYSFAEQANLFSEVLNSAIGNRKRLSLRGQMKKITAAALDCLQRKQDVEFLEYARSFYAPCLRGRISAKDILETISRIDSKDPYILTLSLKAVEAVVGAEGAAAIQKPLRKTFLASPYAQVVHLEREMYRLASNAEMHKAFGKAIPIFERILDNSRDTELRAGAAFHLGEMALASNNHAQAAAFYGQCVDLNPNHRKGKERLQEIGDSNATASEIIPDKCK